ncbi:hypothetical protein [Burkholderia ambifaria]|uniref:hypothetical protein n=1 Tax=Burkholderia ambifaria TaxID=152480 RepID=UPI0015896793|nr:hypothetical protein [Burkholderia ambifaria]
MTVSDEIVLSMTVIMTAFAPGENRSMLNQPFPNGKACKAENPAERRAAFPRGKVRSRNAQARLRAPWAESLPLRGRPARLASAATRRLGGHQDRKTERRNTALRTTRRSGIGQPGRRY